MNFELKEVLSLARMEFELNNHSIMEPYHILMGILVQPNGIGWKILSLMDVDLGSLSETIQNEFALKLDIVKLKDKSDIKTDGEVKQILIDTSIISEELRMDMSVEILLLGMMESDNKGKEILIEHGLDEVKLKSFIVNTSREEIEEKYLKTEQKENEKITMGEELNELPNLTVRKNKKNDLPILSSFGTNLNDLAKDGKIGRVFGREEELDRMMVVLMRKTKRNPLIIGEAGVGKTALAEGLAQKIVDKDVHEYFLDKVIYTVDLPSMVAGTKFRGEFEERLKGLVKELVANPNIIIFLDELHQLIGSGSTSGGTMDGANIIKPELSRGSIQVIGATTYAEYKEHIAKDGAMSRRFQNINLVEPTEDQTIEILKNAKDKFEKYHGVVIGEDLIGKIVKYAGRYISTKRFPDKAFDLLDEVSAYVKYNNNILSDEQLEAKKNYHDAEAKYSETIQLLKTLITRADFDKAAEVRDQLKKLKANTRVLNSVLEKEMSKVQTSLKPTEDDLIRTVKLVTGVEVSKIDDLDINYLLTLEDKLNTKVIGQEEAVEVMSQGVIRKKTGIKDPNKPLVYLFLGQTGVGKTLLVKEIAKEVYGSESKFIRINMSDYQDSYTVSNITGSAKGYVGSETGSFLYEKVKHNPDSIILLDEVEKAHSNVFNAFLQIFDEGQAVTNDGEVISFKETIIVMTSNLGVKEVSESQKSLSLFQSDSASDQRASEAYNKALKTKFSPEVLNRITKIVTFNPIKKENALGIAKIEMKKLIDRVASIGKTLKVKKSAYDFLAENGFSKEYGARFLNRTIEQEVEIPLSYYILKNPEQETISVEIKSGKIIFK